MKHSTSVKLYEAVLGWSPTKPQMTPDVTTPVGLFRSIWIDPNRKPWLAVIASEVLHAENIRKEMIAEMARDGVG